MKNFFLIFHPPHLSLPSVRSNTVTRYYTYTITINFNCWKIVYTCSFYISLALTFHSVIAVQLQRITSKYYYTDEWILHLSRLAIQIPAVIVCNVFMVVYMHGLYNIRAYHGYLFLCLVLESICGMHLGKTDQSQGRRLMSHAATRTLTCVYKSKTYKTLLINKL